MIYNSSDRYILTFFLKSPLQKRKQIFYVFQRVQRNFTLDFSRKFDEKQDLRNKILDDLPCLTSVTI